MDRHIVCFSIPALSISLARLANPSLHTRPVAVASSLAPRSPITEASLEAQQDGVLPGLHVAQARQQCPSLHILPLRTTHVRQAHHALVKTISQFSPVWEPIQPGHFFFDLTGTTRLFGLACDTTMRIKREITHHYGLVGVAGLASNKLVARIASTVIGPPQLCDIHHGSEEAFLSPLPITTLPLNPSRANMIIPLLADLNIHTLQDLADIEVTHLEMVLGQQARSLHAWAHGNDSSPVLCPSQQPHIEASVNLDPPEIDSTCLHRALYELLERICRRLRAQQRMCHSIGIEFQYRDGGEVMKAHEVRPGTYWEVELAPYVTKLFTHGFQRRVRVRRLTVYAKYLTSFMQQGELFDEEAMGEPFGDKKAHRITRALDHIRTRFGSQTIWWGKTHARIRTSTRPL